MASTPYYFISYSRRQYFIAKRLAEQLRAAQLPVWLDVEQIAPGDDWQESIERGLRGCGAVILLGSRSASRSTAVQDELAATQRHGKPIYLVALESCPLVQTLTGKAAIIDCRINFTGRISQLIEHLRTRSSLSARKIERSVLDALPPLGSSKLLELLLLNLCFLCASIAMLTRTQITIHWPIDPRVEPFLIVAATLPIFWLLSFGYSLYLLLGFRLQWRMSFLELEAWPKLCIYLVPVLGAFLLFRFNSVYFGDLANAGEDFGSAINATFAISYRSGTLGTLLAFGFIVLAGFCYYVFLGDGRFKVVYLIAAVFCTLFALSGMLIGAVVIGGGSMLWTLFAALSGRTIPLAFGQPARPLSLPWRKRRASGAGDAQPAPRRPDDENLWGYWLLPGAFPRTPDEVMHPTPVAARAASPHGATWRLHYIPADEPTVRKIRALLAQQPGISETTTGTASYEIALLSNRTPRRWIAQLAATYPHLIGIFVSSIEYRALPPALHQNQWIDYRQQQPQPIRHLAALIAGKPTTTVTAIPEDFIRPVGPFPFKLASHLLRINGVLELVAAVSALLVQLLFQVPVSPAALIAWSAALGLWSLWAGSRILARNITFVELCALTALNLLTAGAWAILGGATLLPRELHIGNGPYNNALRSGIGIIAVTVALPLVLFAIFGLVEFLLHLRTFATWLPTAPLTLQQTLGVAPWRQFDFAYAPYILSVFVLVATLVSNTPARYSHTLEFDVPEGGTQIESLITGPDRNLWYVTHTFTTTTSRSGVSTFQRDAIGWIDPDGTTHTTRYTLATQPYCFAGFLSSTPDCPLIFGKDGSLEYLNDPLNKSIPYVRIWQSATGSITRQVSLPAGTLGGSGAVFDGGGNLWYLRQPDPNQLVDILGRMDEQGNITEYPSYVLTTNPVLAPDGTIWLADATSHSIIHVDMTGTTTAYTDPRIAKDNIGLDSMIAAPDNTLWFFVPRSGLLGHLANGTFTFTQTTFSGLNARVLVGAHDTIWLFYSAPDVVAYLAPDGALRYITLETPLNVDNDKGTYWLAVGGDGSLYYAQQREVGRITPQGAQSHYEIPTLNATIQQLAADPRGTIWFSEGPSLASTDQWSIIGKFMA